MTPKTNLFQKKKGLSFSEDAPKKYGSIGVIEMAILS